MIEAPKEFLPLGSVVRLRGSDKLLMIIGRGLVFHRDAPEVDEGSGSEAEAADAETAGEATAPAPAPTKEYYDYGLCLYPEGVMGDALIYSNHDCVDEVLWRGYSDDENAASIASILDALADLDIPRGNPQPADEW